MGIAVVGAGYWGPNLVRNVVMCPDASLRWVCDRDAPRAERLANVYAGVRSTADLDQVLSDPSVHAVVVATPPSTHADIAVACLQAGKHVLIEKPLAASVAEARRILDAADAADLVVMCDHTYCYTPAVALIASMIEAGDLGDIVFVDCTRVNLGLVRNDVDVLWDLAPHDLSILECVLPADRRPRSVSAWGADPLRTGQACIGHLTMPLCRGAVAHVHVNWLSPTKMRTFAIGGSRRTVVWDDVNPMQRVMVVDRGAGSLADDRSAITSAHGTRCDVTAPALRDGEALAGVVTEFVASVREGRPPKTDGQAGLRVLEILEGASLSLQRGGAAVDLHGQLVGAAR
jgi:predicted dehydrogenase